MGRGKWWAAAEQLSHGAFLLALFPFVINVYLILKEFLGIELFMFIFQNNLSFQHLKKVQSCFYLQNALYSKDRSENEEPQHSTRYRLGVDFPSASCQYDTLGKEHNSVGHWYKQVQLSELRTNWRTMLRVHGSGLATQQTFTTRMVPLAQTGLRLDAILWLNLFCLESVHNTENKELMANLGKRLFGI